MLSVLIPIFNLNVNPLVTELDRQLAQAGIPYEIILADDCSTDLDIREKNAGLSQLDKVQYIQNHYMLFQILLMSFHQKMLFEYIQYLQIE